MDRRTAKRSYLNLVRDVEGILKRCDPLRLLQSGAPADEYEPEARAIVARLRHCDTVDACRDAIADVFGEQFGETDRSAESDTLLASEVFALKSRANVRRPPLLP